MFAEGGEQGIRAFGGRQRFDEGERAADRLGAPVGLLAVTHHQRVLRRDTKPAEQGLEDRGIRFDRAHLEGQHELVDVPGQAVAGEGRPDVERDVAQHADLQAGVGDGLESGLSVRIGRPLRGIDKPVVERLGLFRPEPGLAQHLEVDLLVQSRVQVAVVPGVLVLIGQLHHLTAGCGHPAHDLGLRLDIECGPVVVGEFGEPAGVVLQPEQCAGEIEHHGLNRHSSRLTAQVPARPDL